MWWNSIHHTHCEQFWKLQSCRHLANTTERSKIGGDTDCSNWLGPIAVPNIAISLFVSMSVIKHILKTARLNFIKFWAHVACSGGSVLSRRCDVIILPVLSMTLRFHIIGPTASDVKAGGWRDRSPLFKYGGIILPTFQAKLRVTNTLHGS